MLNAIAAAVAATDLAAWAAGDPLAYPVANALHLVGLVMLVGGIGLLDLRLMGLWPQLPVAPLARAVQPVAVIGLLLLMATGTVLFAADAVALAGSQTFLRKLILLGLALLNAALFRLLWRRPMLFGAIRPEMRAMAALSLALWLAVLWNGRMIAYS